MMTSYVCFDLETTGLSPDKDEIIEIGGVKVEEGKVTDRFSRFIKPTSPISDRVRQITGIDNDMVAEALPTEEVIFDFIEFCKGQPLLGHNISFDYRFMKRYAAKYYMPFEKAGVDTLKIARIVHKDLPSRSLGSLCDHYQIINPSAHRAYHDALATAKIYQSMKHYFGKERPELFEAISLDGERKKIQPATARQKVYLKDLAKYHKIKLSSDVDTLTRSEASRMIDGIIFRFGRMLR